MCYCNPNIRTPHCGNVGCVLPIQVEEEDIFVYIPKSEYQGKYFPITTKAGNSLHKTLSQAKKKLIHDYGVNKGLERKGKVCKYKLVLVEEIETGVVDE